MENFEEIKQRNITLISKFRTDFNISQSLEEILSYESLQIHKELPKNRIRFMGLLKTNIGLDEEGKEKFKTKRVQLYTHKLQSDVSPRILSIYSFIRVIHVEYKKILEIEDFENKILPIHLSILSDYETIATL